MGIINLLHPFSAESIGLKENDLYHSHSKPHQLALESYAAQTGHKTSISYFTQRILPYKKVCDGVLKKFYPVTAPLGKRKSSWRAQHSLWHYHAVPAAVTIINMSGHGSKYTFKYAEKLQQKKRPYIAMIGGVNMSLKGKALNYYKNAHHILVHTRLQQQNLLKQAGFETLDIRVLPLGIDTQKFTFKNDILTDKLQLLFVGRITPLKRIELAIDVIAKLNERGVLSELKVVGFVSDRAYFESLIKKMTELKVSDQIKFLGAVKQDDLIPYYQAADMLLLPSEHESFGMVMVEAMACGTPVAAVRGSGGPEEIITHTKDGILSNKNDYAHEVSNLLENPEKLDEVSQTARTKVLNKFSLQKTKQILSESINDVIKENYA